MTDFTTDDRIPVSLLTGFLGSGKTTVLNHLVRQPELATALVIINEFGEMSLDHLLVTHSTDNVVMEMSNGCLCCTMRGDLIETLRKIQWHFSHKRQRQFDRVFIETTGLADPASIIHTLMTHPQTASQYKLDGVIACVDMATGMQTLDNHQEAVKQAALADVLLLTKSDLADTEQDAALRNRLKVINPAAAKICVNNGEVAPSQILNLGLFNQRDKIPDVARWLAEESHHAESHHSHGHDDHGHGHDHGHSHSHDHHDLNRHDDHIRAFCFSFDDPIEDTLLTLWVETFMSLVGNDILRVKGIINVKGYAEPWVIHGVQHIFHPPALLPAWPDESCRSRFVFITRDVDRSVIEKTFDALKTRPAQELDSAS